MTFNDVVAWLLRSPLHGMLGRSLMLVELTGRKTGRAVRLPVNFQRQAGELWVISSRKRVWWRNLQDHPRAVLWIGGKQITAKGDLLLDESAVAERLEQICARDGRLAQALHVRLDAQRMPKPEDLQNAARERLFIRFVPSG